MLKVSTPQLHWIHKLATVAIHLLLVKLVLVLSLSIFFFPIFLDSRRVSTRSYIMLSVRVSHTHINFQVNYVNWKRSNIKYLINYQKYTVSPPADFSVVGILACLSRRYLEIELGFIRLSEILLIICWSNFMLSLYI